MPNRRIHDDSKKIALRMIDRGRDSRDEIAAICGFSKRTLGRTLRRYRTTGSVARAAPIGTGRPRLLHARDSLYLLRLAKHQPCTFLDEYQKFLHKHRHLPASISTIHRTFERAGLSVKNVQKMASERDPMQEGEFVARIAEYPANYLVPLDEMSKDNRTYARLWGRSAVGSRVEVYNPFVRKRRYTAIAAMALDKGIIACRVIEGSSDRDTFIHFLETDLLPVMNPYPGPQSVLLLDNARIHHSDEIHELVESYGCRIEYLPPYSPHYNPIEQVFSVIKSHLRRIGLGAFPASTAYYELYRAFQIITPEMTWGFFRHSGLV